MSFNFFLFFFFSINCPQISGYVCFVNNQLNLSSGNGTYENPFSNMTSAILDILNQNDSQNFIIISSNNNINDLSNKIQLKNEVSIETIDGNNDDATLVFSNNASFCINSTLNLTNLIIRIENQGQIDNLFTLGSGSSINFHVIYHQFFFLNLT